jgi:hypothetical protein
MLPLRSDKLNNGVERLIGTLWQQFWPYPDSDLDLPTL